MSNVEYRRWVHEAWEQLEQDFRSGKFAPLDEPDVQGHLYHCMFQAKSEFAPTNDVLLTLEWHNVDVGSHPE